MQQHWLFRGPVKSITLVHVWNRSLAHGRNDFISLDILFNSSLVQYTGATLALFGGKNAHILAFDGTGKTYLNDFIFPWQCFTEQFEVNFTAIL